MLTRRNIERARRKCKKYGWSPLNDPGLVEVWTTGINYTTDGDGKLQFWTGMLAGKIATWIVRPTLITSDPTMGNAPTIDCSVGAYATVGSWSSVATPWSIWAVAKLKSGAVYRALVSGAAADANPGIYTNAGNDSFVLRGAVTYTSVVTQNVPLSISGNVPVSPAVGSLNLNGTVTTGVAGTVALNQLSFGANPAGTYPWNSTIADIAIFRTIDITRDALLVAYSKRRFGVV